MLSQATIYSARERIQRAQEEIADLERQLGILQKEDPEKQLARELHSQFCTHNHTDGCGWFYEVRNGIDDWSDSSHADWLDRAGKVLAQCQKDNIDPVAAIRVYKLIRGY